MTPVGYHCFQLQIRGSCNEYREEMLGVYYNNHVCAGRTVRLVISCVVNSGMRMILSMRP